VVFVLFELLYLTMFNRSLIIHLLEFPKFTDNDFTMIGLIDFAVMTFLSVTVRMVFVTAYVSNVTTGNIIEKRKWHSAVPCEFPVHPDIIAVTPHLDSRGWAYSYDHPAAGKNSVLLYCIE
jgi:hypothetical protein